MVGDPPKMKVGENVGANVGANEGDRVGASCVIANGLLVGAATMIVVSIDVM